MQEDRHAISGYVFMLNGGAVSWSSKWQDTISLSTTKAEYIALTHAAKEAIWFRNLLLEIFSPINHPITIHSDNQSAIALAKDDRFHARTKHIDIWYHFICYVIEEGKIRLTYCPTEDMTVDIFTKALTSLKAKHGVHGTSKGLKGSVGISQVHLLYYLWNTLSLTVLYMDPQHYS